MEMIIFCGIQATGKTSFYRDNFLKTHIRLSLDLLNTRNKEQLFMTTCFATGQRFVVDNTNPTKENRSNYITAAKANNFKVIGYYFQSKLADALERNNQRTGKENIPEIGIKGTYSKLEIPCTDEGFDELYFVEISNNGYVIKEWQNEI